MLYLPTGSPTVRVMLNEDTYNATGRPRSMVVNLDVMEVEGDPAPQPAHPGYSDIDAHMDDYISVDPNVQRIHLVNVHKYDPLDAAFTVDARLVDAHQNLHLAETDTGGD